MKQPVMGIQLFTLRDFMQNAADMDQTLGRLAAMGVRDVQISAIGDIPAETQRDILQKHGMRVCVTHKSLERMKGDLDALIEEHKIIGCPDIGLGAAPEDARGNQSRVRAFIQTMQEIGKKMQAQGCRFHYHNHAFEYYRLDDSCRCMMDLLLEETDPDVFSFIPDLAWMHFAGQDPVQELHRMVGRVKVVHFKDYVFDDDGNRHFVPLGQGIVDLEACYRAVCELEIPYVMYEHDNDWPENDPFLACEQSWAYLQNLLK